jgi:ABC-2 type transport system permease protein
VREREIGTLEQLLVTPIRPIELMLGKVLPFVFIGYTNIVLVTGVAVLWFQVPIAGSFPLLLLLSAAFLVTSLGLGLLVSTISRTQQQAMMVSFFVIQPSILLSGFIFPIANMPKTIQYITCLIPLRYYMEIVRGVFLRGVGLSVLWPQVLVLCVMGAFLITVSTIRFTKKTD